MPVTLQNVISDIRENIESWPIKHKLAQSLTADEGEIRIPKGIISELASDRGVIQIGGEVLKLAGKAEKSDYYFCLRGWQDTTPEKHNKGDAIEIFPAFGFTKHELVNLVLPSAFRFLRPHFYTLTFSSTFTWSSGEYEVAAPTGVQWPEGNWITRLQYQDAGTSKYFNMNNWILRGSTIFMGAKASQDRTLRAEILQFQDPLTALTATLDNDASREPLVQYASSLALNKFKAQRTRFAEYSASLDERASGIDELIRQAFDFRQQAIVSRDERGMPLPPGYASTYSEPRP